MAGARGLWRANGMKDSQFGKPVIAIVNSFTQFVPGHVHLHEIGQEIKSKIEELELLIPQDEEFLGYKKKFESVIRRYKLSL